MTTPQSSTSLPVMAIEVVYAVADGQRVTVTPDGQARCECQHYRMIAAMYGEGHCPHVDAVMTHRAQQKARTH